MTRTPQEVGQLVKRLQHRHHRALTTVLADLGISLVQWDTMRHLDRNPGASLHDLAQLTFQTDQAFGTLSTRMAERGLIERVPGPGRAVRHRLTERGQRLRQAGEALVDEGLAGSFAPLTADQLDQLGDLLHQLLESPTTSGTDDSATPPRHDNQAHGRTATVVQDRWANRQASGSPS